MRLSARYDFKHSNAITASLVEHDLRSVGRIDPDKLRRRLEPLSKHLKNDPTFMQVYGRKYNTVVSSMNLYVALHLLLAVKSRDWARFAFSALRADFAGSVSQAIFWGTVKHYLLLALRR